jgi:hypothetical protein
MAPAQFSREKEPMKKGHFMRISAAVAAGITFWAANPQAAEVPLHAILVGGGPDLENNGAEIESHLRFAAEILPRGAQRFIHFTDGKSRGKTVSFTDSAKLSPGRRALHTLLPNGGFGPEAEARKPEIGQKLEGAARRDAIRASIGKIPAKAGESATPVLLYFAGHGSENSWNAENNSYHLWDNEQLSVSHLASEISRLPVRAPIALIMVQCYSGAFANVLFRYGDPANDLIEHDLAGFFAASKDREAAGCGTEIHEPHYQDFSSYFFGALCGRSRLGQPVTGADYDGDGTVNMYEAFCFALIHDDSPDTPTCTSQAFLSRFVSLANPELYATPFAKIMAAANPAQQAALTALSEKLELTGEDRLITAFDRLNFRNPIARAALVSQRAAAQERLSKLQEQALAGLFQRHPALRWAGTDAYDAAAEKAEQELTRTRRSAARFSRRRKRCNGRMRLGKTRKLFCCASPVSARASCARSTCARMRTSS